MRRESTSMHAQSAKSAAGRPGDARESTAKVRHFPTRNDLSQSTRDKMIALQNQQLADMLDLMSQVKQAHWNVKGPQFHALHVFFDTIAESVEKWIDVVAERAAALGGFVKGTARMAVDASRLAEYPTDAVDGREHLEALTERFAVLVKSTREAIDTADEAEDADTADLLTDVSRAFDQHLWMLESHLTK